MSHIDNRKSHIIQQCLLHVSSQYGELRPTNGWHRLASLGHPSKFQRVSRLGFITAPTSLNGGQPKFARCLAVSWAATVLVPWRNSARCIIHIASKYLLYWQRYCTALEQRASPKVCDVVQGMELQNFLSSSLSTKGARYIPTAAITLGIGPHCSFLILFKVLYANTGNTNFRSS